MSSSTLSDALNPYASQSRPRTSDITYTVTLQPVDQSTQQYVPHRSELELAVAEPQPPPPQPRKASAEGIHAVQELLRVVYATREAQEIERRRRLAWEQEQEAKHIQRQAEMERQMFEMRQEIQVLRSLVGVPSRNIPVASFLPPRRPQDNLQMESPISPVSQSSSNSQTAYVQASPVQNLLDPQIRQIESSTAHRPEVDNSPVLSITPSPSPQLGVVQPLQPFGVSTSTAARRKRSTPISSEDEDADASGSESSASNQSRPLKRINHHDKRCLTIHHAMRSHFVRVMGLESDKSLPDSHMEGLPLGDDQPVRFVWDKTTKQSVHNARMKARVISDLKANRKLYKHVLEKDFSKKVLDSVFDQCFTTFRQKFKAQRDESTALATKRREDTKAMKARRLARKKAKLSSRADARIKNEVFVHVTFDGAFQMECMSSEESDLEGGSSSGTSSGLLRSRGLPWRSTRLQTFFEILDEDDRVSQRSKPKRGSGKKGRIPGPPKEGFHMPPKGVSSWMISKRWIVMTQSNHPDLLEALNNLVDDQPGFDWGGFHTLGGESDDEGEISPVSTMNTHAPQSVEHQYYTTTTSSLQYALV